MNCKNHQEKQAGYQCAKCKNYFCGSCTDIRKISDDFTAYICKECGGKCDPIAESASKGAKQKTPFVKPPIVKESKVKVVEEKTSKSPSENQPQVAPKLKHTNFWSCLPGVLIFPFKGKGFFTTLIMSALFYGLFELSKIAVLKLVYLAATFIVVTYFGVYLLKVIEDSFHGSTRLEDLPGKDYWDHVGWPVLNLFCAVVIFFFPSQIYFLQFKNLDWIFFALLGLGVFLFPMSIMSAIILRKLYSVNPIRIVASVFKTFFAYLILNILIGGFAILIFYVYNDYLSDYGRYGQAGSRLLIVYVLFMQVRLVGLFAKFYEGKIRLKTTGEA